MRLLRVGCYYGKGSTKAGFSFSYSQLLFVIVDYMEVNTAVTAHSKNAGARE